MSNFSNDLRAKEKQEEREKTARETLGKTFHDLGKTAFAVMVVGNAVTLFGISQNTTWQIVGSMSLGIAATAGFIYIGNKILKKK